MNDATKTTLVFAGLAAAAGLASYAARKLVEQKSPIVEAEALATARAAAAQVAAEQSASRFRYFGDLAVDGGSLAYEVTSEFAEVYAKPWAPLARRRQPAVGGESIAQLLRGQKVASTGRLGGFEFSPSLQLRYLYPASFLARFGGYAEVSLGDGVYGWVNLSHLKSLSA